MYLIPMSTKRQFKMYLDEDVFERLRAAAEKYDRDSGQTVVAELIAVYLPTWTAVNESMRRAVDFQLKQNHYVANHFGGVPVAPVSKSEGIPLIETPSPKPKEQNVAKKKNKRVA